MKSTAWMLFASVSLAACAINQHVEQAELDTNAKVCIIENADVREGFLKELRSVLYEKNIDHTVTDRDSARKNCKWTLTYLARWSWDLTIYMSYAEIRVFKDGVLDGEAIYDSTGGGANMSKFIDAEPKIRELVDELMQKASDPSHAQKSNTKSQEVQACIDLCVERTFKSPEQCFDDCVD